MCREGLKSSMLLTFPLKKRSIMSKYIYRLLIIIPFLYGCATDIPPSCMMRAGSAMMGASDLNAGMAASGNVYADCFEKQGK